MIGIILAAGRGSRLGPMTENRPKGLVAVCGRPLIAWQIEALRKAGVSEIALVGGYHHEALEGFGDRVLVNDRWASSNMVVSLGVAGPLLASSPCLVSYSDIVCHSSIPERLMQARGDIAMTYDTDWLALWSKRFSDPLSDAESFRFNGNRLVEIGCRTDRLDDIQGQYMGLTKFTPAGWSEVTRHLSTLPPEQVDRLDMTSMFASLLERNVAIEVVPVSGRWCEVDSQDDLSRYEQELTAGVGRWSHDWRG